MSWKGQSRKRYGGSKSREALTREEMKRFLDFVRYDKHFKIYFDGMYILFNTGLRISEFCGLTVSDIDFKNHTIRVNKQLVRNMIEEKSTIYINLNDDIEKVYPMPTFEQAQEVAGKLNKLKDKKLQYVEEIVMETGMKSE